MRLQIVFVLLIGIIAALNSNYYNDPHEYEDTYSNDYYENYDETIMTSKEKIIELIRVYNEFPCKKFLLSSNGLIQTLSPNKLGVYSLAEGLFEDRFVYLRETPTELLVLFSYRDDNGDYMEWAIVPIDWSDREDLKLLDEDFPLVNTDCRDTELPANGDCDDGWHVYINITHILPDETASIDCLEYLNNDHIFDELTSMMSTISTETKTSYNNESSKVTRMTPGVSSDVHTGTQTQLSDYSADKVSIDQKEKLVLSCHASSKWQFCGWQKTLHYDPNETCAIRYHFDWSNTTSLNQKCVCFNNTSTMNSCDEQFDNPVYRTHQDNKIVKGVCEIEFSSAHISLAGRWSCWLYECENSGHDCWTNNDITEGGSMMNLTRKEFLVEIKQHVSSLANANIIGLESISVITTVFIISMFL